MSDHQTGIYSRSQYPNGGYQSEFARHSVRLGPTNRNPVWHSTVQTDWNHRTAGHVTSPWILAWKYMGLGICGSKYSVKVEVLWITAVFENRFIYRDKDKE